MFTDIPDGLGQNGWTSRIRDWKPRFNYGWDWIPRLVQIGIPEAPVIELRDAVMVDRVDVRTEFDPVSGAGVLHVRGAGSRGPPARGGDRRTRGRAPRRRFEHAHPHPGAGRAALGGARSERLRLLPGARAAPWAPTARWRTR